MPRSAWASEGPLDRHLRHRHGHARGLLKAAGHDVRGSDEHVYPPMSVQLQDQKIPCFEGFGAANLDWGPDAVVVGNVCRKDHVEVLAAQAQGIPLESFPSLSASCSYKTPRYRGHHRTRRTRAGRWWSRARTADDDVVAARACAADAKRDPSF